MTEPLALRPQAAADKPHRVQRLRTKGWRLPTNTVCVTRPSRWGNPWVIGQSRCLGAGLDFHCEEVVDAATAVRFFREMLSERVRNYPPNENIVAILRGKNLACYCPLDQPCHADVLLEIANAEPEK